MPKLVHCCLDKSLPATVFDPVVTKVGDVSLKLEQE